MCNERFLLFADYQKDALPIIEATQPIRDDDLPDNYTTQ